MVKFNKTKEEALFQEIETIIENNNLPAFEKKIIQCKLDLNIRDEFENSLLHIAALKGSVSIIEFLLHKNLDINSKNHVGKTPLHLAIKNDNIEVSLFLIKNGADYKTRDRNGRTAIESATRDKRVIIQKYLR